MITYEGHPCTANEFAKLVVCNYGEYGGECWEDLYRREREIMTDLEADNVNKALIRQMVRVAKLFRPGPLLEKLWAKKPVIQADGSPVWD